MKRTVINFSIAVVAAVVISIPAVVLANSNNRNSDRTPPKLTYLHIESNNTDPSVATAGDKVTISLTASEKVTPIVLVESRVLFARATNTGGNSWDASYTVDPRDPTGKVDYLITLSDPSGNIYICTSARLPFQIVPRCQTTDGSSVTVSKTVQPPADTQAPVIAAHEDITTGGNAGGIAVTYTNPTATDNVDASVSVSCSPASGSVFALGTTTVTCSAQDAAGNNATPTTFNVIVVDIMAPVIEPHENISVHGTQSGAVVNYSLPTTTDNVDASVTPSCTPAPGSTFAVGTTTVTCVAHDAAGNNATPVSFDVGVTAPVPYTMASQPDESFLCSPDWRNCFTGGAPFVSINLGLGSSMGEGTLKSVTIAKDENSPFVSHPWIAEIRCYTDAAYTTDCTDWLQPNGHNGNVSYDASEFTSSSTDNKHWTADFTDPTHEANNDGSSPVKFNPNYYYRLIISDDGWDIAAYGSADHTLPYYVITGMTL